ncbi:MAG TPA: fatty acid desaturase [Acidimicrobiales bacterium]|nr:fatty acid desaturase [Acidimicrobiales bacterium]
MVLPPWLVATLAGLAVCQLATLVTTVYLHRALSHRALTLGGPLTAVLRTITWITTGIKPRQWVAVHRKHHAHTDVEGDPHSPIIEGFAQVQLGNVGLYRKVANDETQVRRYARDLPADAWDRALFDRALLGLGLGIALLVVVLGPWWGLYAAVVHTVSYLLLNAAVNAIGHTWGKQPHPNTARNSQLLALLTAGEGLHNNHHAIPTSARLAMAKGQLDPGWWFIRLCRKLGWATIRTRKSDAVEEPVAA